MKVSYLSKTIALLMLFALSVCAQSQKINADDEQILQHVTVTTKNGDWIIGLKAENFKVYDEKTLQPITFFSAEDGPISVGILVDTSESMDPNIAPAIPQALKSFINKSNPNNEYFLMGFAGEQKLLIDSTQDSKAVLQAVENLSTTKSGEGTQFYDAVQVGLEKILKSKYEKKVLIILSDAMDYKSKNDLGDIKRLIKQTGILVYAVDPMNYSRADDELTYQRILEEITKWNGGRVFFPGGAIELDEVLFRTAEELRSQYIIGFKASKNPDKKEKWHNIQIKVELPPTEAKIGKPFVRAREGYYSNPKSN